MIVKIHYEINGHEDSLILEGESNEEIREKADAELLRRGIATNSDSIEKYNIWSEDIRV